jgi:hypothetical protein
MGKALAGRVFDKGTNVMNQIKAFVKARCFHVYFLLLFLNEPNYRAHRLGKQETKLGRRCEFENITNLNFMACLPSPLQRDVELRR